MWSASSVLGTECLPGRLEHEFGIAKGGQRHPPDTVHVFVDHRTRCVCGQARLTRSARPGQRKQSDVLAREQAEHLLQLVLSAQERRRGDGQIRLVQALQWREIGITQLEDALGRREVLQPVVAQVAESLVSNQAGRRRRNEHLAAVADCGNPCRPMDVCPDVALAGDEWRSRVDAHAHPDWPGGQRGQRSGRRLERARRRRERDEEGVPLRVHLDAAVGAECLSKEAAMLCQRLGVRLLPKLMQEPRRTLDVGEEKRDGAGRKILTHAAR